MRFAPALILACCVFLAARADDNAAPDANNPITRAFAISVAKSRCPEYPDRFGFVDKAEWIPGKGYWVVQLDDRSGDHGRIYYIDRTGKVVGTKEINGTPPKV
ncbi:MAG TPA: hypothetical protein VG733_00875 [Chthoniobacteraceae bacterium]|nr:hypothetical protein [Chthoniobacteraceae bacterium]